MDRSTLLSPWRILLGLLPLCYAVLLAIALENTVVWLSVLGAVFLVLLVVAASFDYPLLVGWPAFSWFIVLVACGIMLYQGVPDTSAVPLTRSSLELWGVGFLAGVALIWVVRRTRLMNEI